MLNTTVYPGRLRHLMIAFRGAMQFNCPDIKLRLTYAPFDNLDVLIEIYVARKPSHTMLTTLGEEIGKILAEGYTVRAVIKDTSWEPTYLIDLDLLITANA
jgi:hypothetical protein